MRHFNKHLLLYLILVLFGCTTSETGTGQSASQYPDLWLGSYMLNVSTDSTQVDFKIELVTAKDSAVYGYISSQDSSVNYKSPISLDSTTSDSLYFHAFTHTLVLAKSDSSGVFDFYNNQYIAEMMSIDKDVRQSLLNSRDMIPIKLDIAAKSMAWAAPATPDRIYLVNDRLIYLAEKAGKVWKTTRVEYDTASWEFYSIGLSPDQKTIITHGRPLKDSLPTEGKGDYYLLHLKSPTEVDGMSHLPTSINTDSYDIFPSFTPDGDILLSTWGQVEGLEPTGRGNIYMAKMTENGYDVNYIDKSLNTPNAEAGVFMDHKKRFIIFHKKNREKGLSDRLFISKKTSVGWSTPKLMGPPVTRDFTWTYGGRIDPEGKYLFFNSGFRGQTEIFGVPTDEVPELSPFFN